MKLSGFDQMYRRTILHIGRKTFFAPHLKDRIGDSDYGRMSVQEDTNLEKANLVGSVLPNGNHAPCVDLDGIPVTVVPSSTPGNCHLYIDKEMTWEQYRQILDAFYNAGLIQRGWYREAYERRCSFLRLPGVKKDKPTSGAPF